MSNNDPAREISSNLTLSDMKAINTLIEVASVKGIFKASDLTLFGAIYEKIVSLLKNS